MFSSSYPRQNHARWRVVLLILAFSGNAELSASAPTKVAEVTTKPSTPAPLSLASFKGSSNQEVGSPSELAWQAWLLVDTRTGEHSGLDSASLLRRITPKSVFIAPHFNQKCAEGYELDKLKRCVKIIRVDQEKQLAFYLQRLNSLYAQPKPLAVTSNDKKPEDSSGPFQLNIPIIPEVTNIQKTHEEGIEDPVEIPIVVRSQDSIPAEGIKEETIIEMEEISKSEDKVQKDKTTFFHSNFNSSSTLNPISGFVVPVVDFVEEMNTTFSEVVDYKIVENRTHDTEQNHKDDTVNIDDDKNEDSVTTTITTTTAKIITENASPTWVLFLTPTKLPTEMGELEASHNASLGHVILRLQNATGNWTSKEMIGSVIPLPDNIHIAAEVEIPQNDTEDTKITNDTHESDDIYSDEESPLPEGDFVDQEDYSTEDSITETTDDDFAETTEDELLRPGEAGITIPIIKNQESRPKEILEVTTPSKVFNLSVIDEEPEFITTENSEGNVSSEVSINDDFILETTLLDVNTQNMSNSTESVSIKIDTSSEKQENSDIFEMEKEFLPEPEVVFSYQDHHPISSGRKRTGQVTMKLDEKPHSSIKISVSVPPSSVSQKQSFVMQDEAIDEQASFNTERIVLPDFLNHKHFQPSVTNYKQNQENFVRFPNYEERQSPSYVRFPSDEVNSIHGSDYKLRLSYPHDDFASTTSTKSSVPIHQKQSHWRIPQGFRTDRQQTTFRSPQGESSSSGQRQKQRPMLLRFWAKMPLLRDPSLYPNTSHGSHNEPIGGNIPRYPQNTSSRRSNFNNEEISRQLIGG